MIPNQQTTSAETTTNGGQPLCTETYYSPAAEGRPPVRIEFTDAGGAWECANCDTRGFDPDHLVARGAAAGHNITCGDSGRAESVYTAPRRAHHIPLAAPGPFYQVVTITGDTWECDCGATGPGDRVDGVTTAEVTAEAARHAATCGRNSLDVALRDAETGRENSTAVALVLHKAIAHIARLHDHVDRIDHDLADIPTTADHIAYLREQLTHAQAQATEAQEQAAERALDRRITDLQRRITAERGDIGRADTKAGQQVTLVSVVGGAAAAIAGVTGAAADLPVPVMVAAGASAVAALTSLALAASVSWPVPRHADDTEGDGEGEGGEVDSLVDELRQVRAIAAAKFARLRTSTIAVGVTAVLAVITVVLALATGGAS